MENSSSIVLLVLSSSMFTLSIVLFFVALFFKFQKKRFHEKQLFELELKNKELEKTNAVVQAQEQERAKIARNLHDEVGAVLAMANRNLKSAVEQLPSDESCREDLFFTMDILEQSVDKIRSIAHGMVPHYLVKFGLTKTLQRLMEQTEKALGYPCSFSTNITNELKVNQDRVIHFYSITLELLNNLMKHAHPHSVHVELEKSSTHLLLKITHDGVAISHADYEYLLNRGDGMGLESITLRLKMISGELLYQRISPGGKIELAMPLIETISSDEKVDL